MNPSSGITRILDIDNYLGESPVWSGEEQALYWINCDRNPELHRWSYGSEVHDVWPMPMRIGGLVMRQDSVVTVVLADGVYDFDIYDAALSRRVASPLPEHVKLHECQCDRQGRLWTGAFDHHYSPKSADSKGGAFFRLDGVHLTPVILGINVSNGLAFSPDGRVMYFTDSPTRLVEAADIDPTTGAMSNRRPFVQLRADEGFPDGATVDAEGGYWLATVGVGALRRYRPDGSLDRIVTLPFSNPTKPAFGGPALDTLFITSTQLVIGSTPITGNGGLYSMKPGVCGLRETRLAS